MEVFYLLLSNVYAFIDISFFFVVKQINKEKDFYFENKKLIRVIEYVENTLFDLIESFFLVVEIK